MRGAVRSRQEADSSPMEPTARRGNRRGKFSGRNSGFLQGWSGAQRQQLLLLSVRQVSRSALGWRPRETRGSPPGTSVSWPRAYSRAIETRHLTHGPAHPEQRHHSYASAKCQHLYRVSAVLAVICQARLLRRCGSY